MEGKQSACAALFWSDVVNDRERPAAVALLTETDFRPYREHIGDPAPSVFFQWMARSERWRDMAIWNVRSESDIDAIRIKSVIRHRMIAFFTFAPFVASSERIRLVRYLYERVRDARRLIYNVPLAVFEDAPLLLRGSLVSPALQEAAWVANGTFLHATDAVIKRVRDGDMRLVLGWSYRHYEWMEALSFEGQSLEETLRCLPPGIFLALDGRRWTTVAVPRIETRAICLDRFRAMALEYSEV
jgi:hypothetical protein